MPAWAPSDKIILRVKCSTLKTNGLQKTTVSRSMNTKFLTLLIALLLGGCTTIEISEADVFDNSATISKDQFPIHSYTHHGLKIETDDGESIDAWFLEQEGADKTVIYYGGNGFLMMKSRPLIDAYSDVPVHLLLIDYRGYGRSSGEPSVAGVKSDAEAAYQAAKSSLPVEPGPIYIHGHSMGSFLATHIAHSNEVEGYILESPVSDVESWTKGIVPLLLRPFVRFDIAEPVKNQNNGELVRHIDKPLLIIGGELDEVTPYEMAEELYEKSISTEKKLVRVENGNHNDLPKSKIYKRALKEFFDE